MNFKLDDLLISQDYEVIESIDIEDFKNLIDFAIDFYQTAEFKFNYGSEPNSFENFLFKLKCKDDVTSDYGKLMLYRNNIAKYLYINKKTYRDLPFIQMMTGQPIIGIVNEEIDEI